MFVTAFVLAMLLLLAWMVPLAIVFSTGWSTPYDGKQPEAFDREAWIDAADDWNGHRYLMVDDLMKNHSPVGLLRGELEELLGPLDPTAAYPSFQPCYYLGPEPSPVGVDNIWLVPEFSGDRVVAMTLRTD